MGTSSASWKDAMLEVLPEKKIGDKKKCEKSCLKPGISTE